MSVTQLSKNFRLEEFAVSASHPELVRSVPPEYQENVELLVDSVLQPLRDAWGKPMRVDSGYRSEALNKAVGGSPTSQHRFAEAADISTDDIVEFFKQVKRGGYPVGQVIYYPKQHFVHIALPGRRYPEPSFFISRAKKSYEPIDPEEVG